MVSLSPRQNVPLAVSAQSGGLGTAVKRGDLGEIGVTLISRP